MYKICKTLIDVQTHYQLYSSIFDAMAIPYVQHHHITVEAQWLSFMLWQDKDVLLLILTQHYFEV